MHAHPVVVREVTSELPIERSVGPEGDAVDDVRLQRMEEGLHVGVVGDLPRSVHALHEAPRGQPVPEPPRPQDMRWRVTK